MKEDTEEEGKEEEEGREREGRKEEEKEVVHGTGGHRHGRLHGLVKSCGFWTADGSACGRL